MQDEQSTRARESWLREAARDLRRRGTPTERRLWAVLRDRQLGGHRFRRQHPIGPYSPDFVCTEARLAVEIDGPIHAQQIEYDAERDDELEQRGYRVLRVPAARVRDALAAVLKEIESALQAPTPDQ